MIMTSLQDFKLRGKQISPVSFCELRNSPRNGTKVPEKSVLRETLSSEMTSQSFPVSCFGLAVLYPIGSEISRFWYIKTRGRKIAIECYFLSISFFLYLFIYLFL